jgi:hypothetical protein
MSNAFGDLFGSGFGTPVPPKPKPEKGVQIRGQKVDGAPDPAGVRKVQALTQGAFQRVPRPSGRGA